MINVKLEQNMDEILNIKDLIGYLSLRMNAINEIIEEKLPIILDEVFAYYDNERMENILKYLANEFKNFQIIIFTCSNREEQILSKANVEFNKIQM